MDIPWRLSEMYTKSRSNFLPILLTLLIGFVTAALCLSVGFATEGDYRYLFIANMVFFTLAGALSGSLYPSMNLLLRMLLLNAWYWLYYYTQVLVSPGIVFFPIMNLIATFLGVAGYPSIFRKGKTKIAFAVVILFLCYATAGIVGMPYVYRLIHTHVIQEQSPDFTLLDGEGNSLSSFELANKVVVVDFWATWCRSCIAEFTELEKVQAKYKDEKDVQLLIVNEDNGGNEEIMKKFLTRKPFELPFYVDSNEITYKAFKVEGMPTLFIIDKSGVIRYKAVGYNGADNYADRLIQEIEGIRQND